ncbi:hypothetical protein ACJIZ3_013945 [Penstemon smallii]|uniref:Uncharacterized protein n=1 Tax=Penstemon smallii TaxID=265156 RepID=A0ABD3RK22_9LAMI
MAVSQSSRSRDLDKLLLRPGHLVGPNFEPGEERRYKRICESSGGGGRWSGLRIAEGLGFDWYSVESWVFCYNNIVSGDGGGGGIMEKCV